MRICVLFSLLAVAASLVAGEPGRTGLQGMSSLELLVLLSTDYDQLPAAAKDEEDPYNEICRILRERRQTAFLLKEYAELRDGTARDYLVSCVLYQIDDPAIRAAFERRLGDGESEEDYYVANYLAKTGDRRALAVLNSHYFRYPVSSWQWSFTVALFGKHAYLPAVPNLIGSLDAASLNVGWAALESLQEIYPDAPRHFGSRSEARAYFGRRWRSSPD